MFTSKYISYLFYVNREAALAVITACLFVAHTLAYIAADDLFVQAVMAFGAVVHFMITASFAYGIYRFEKKYGRRS